VLRGVVRTSLPTLAGHGRRARRRSRPLRAGSPVACGPVLTAGCARAPVAALQVGTGETGAVEQRNGAQGVAVAAS